MLRAAVQAPTFAVETDGSEGQFSVFPQARGLGAPNMLIMIEFCGLTFASD